MSAPPSLPQHVSGNGAEIWDWARSLSEWQQRQEKMRALAASIAKVRCGNCYFWMKSSQCPRETNEGGRRRGPSCEGTICPKYEEDPVWSAPTREKRRAELAALRDRDATLAETPSAPGEASQPVPEQSEGIAQ